MNKDEPKIITDVDNFKLMTIVSLNKLKEDIEKVQTALKFAKFDIDFILKTINEDKT